MRIFSTKAEIRARVRAHKRQELSVALVPTMGSLHDGHLALVKLAAGVADRVIVSVFVNPTQFGDENDLASYPRETDRDLELLAPMGVDGVFMPTTEEMYGNDSSTIVDVVDLSGILQGSVRPNHFRGVATVCTKLFNIVQPDAAVFGEKDYQQLILIRRMVKELDMPVTIVGHPTVREKDGLAMSSRNARLSSEDRKAATILNKALDKGERAAAEGATAEALVELVERSIAKEQRAQIKNVDVREAENLHAVSGELAKPAVILLSVQFGDTLLIDQRVVKPSESDTPTDDSQG